MRTFHALSGRLQRIQIALFLHAAYAVGIGVVSVVGRALGMRFLDEVAVKTNWKMPTGSMDAQRMY